MEEIKQEAGAKLDFHLQLAPVPYILFPTFQDNIEGEQFIEKYVPFSFKKGLLFL